MSDAASDDPGPGRVVLTSGDLPGAADRCRIKQDRRAVRLPPQLLVQVRVSSGFVHAPSGRIVMPGAGPEAGPVLRREGLAALRGVMVRKEGRS